MTTNAPYSIDTAIQDEAHNPSRLQAAFFRNLAKRLEGALLSHSKERLVDLNAQFSNLVSLYFKGTTRGAQDAALGVSDAPEDLRQAYSLGQVNFAQLLIATATNRRADDRFSEIFKQASAIKYLKPLLDSDLTSYELASETNTSPENISRKFKEFRALGIADFWKDGRKVINFLTPSAKEALKEVLKSNLSFGDVSFSSDPRLSVVEVLKRFQDDHDLPKHMRHRMSFGLTGKSRSECRAGD